LQPFQGFFTHIVSTDKELNFGQIGSRSFRLHVLHQYYCGDRHQG
jgi:hypothetical protein